MNSIDVKKCDSEGYFVKRACKMRDLNLIINLIERHYTISVIEMIYQTMS